MIAPLNIGSLYLGTIIIFGLIYYISWKINPEIFLVNQEINLRPLSFWRKHRLKRRFDDLTVNPKLSPKSLEEIYTEFVELCNEEITLTAEQKKIENEIEIAKREEGEIGARHNEEVSKNINAFIEQKESELRKKLKDELLAKIESIKDDAANSKILRLKAKSIDSYLAENPNLHLNLANFTNTSVLPDLNTAMRKHDDLTSRYIKITSEINSLYDRQDEMLNTWEKSQRSRLTFLDLLYFSIGVSTTNTFGDIIPNDRKIRYVISAQLLISIIIVGWFINTAFSG